MFIYHSLVYAVPGILERKLVVAGKQMGAPSDAYECLGTPHYRYRTDERNELVGSWPPAQ